MDQAIKDKLMACKSYAEAKPILETVGAGLSAHELLHTAFSIQAKQPDVAQQFLHTVIQEVENLTKIKETDGGASHQSSSTTGVEKIGKEVDAPEGMAKQYDPKDQMGVPINETYGMMPPMGQGMPPMAPKPPMAPQQMGGFQQPNPQIQYAVQEALRQFAPYHNKIVEAIKALDKKIAETVKEVNAPKSLEIGSRMGNVKTPRTLIKETTENPEQELALRRQQIEEANNHYNYIK